jgi:signal transduction histidine kinase
MDKVREILQRAIEQEATSYRKYLDAARETTDPEAKSLLEQLARDEARHRRVLKAQLALLTEAPEGPPEEEDSRGDRDATACELQLQGTARAARVLAEAKHEIEKAQQTREEFYAMVTHDLRSPLISMEAFAKKLLTSLHNKISDKERQKLQWIWKEAGRLEGFVSKFLDLTRLSSGASTLQHEPLNPRVVVDDELKTLLPQARERGLHVEVKMRGVPWVEADAWAVKRIFMNLLDNAVLHGRKGGTIEVGAQGEEGVVRFWVKDDGPGIPAKDLPHIFERFHMDAEGQRGSGLGLAIVRQAVQAHGGRIWAESKEGEGAIFSFTLPKAQREKEATE